MYEQSACRRVLVGQLGHRECSDVTAPDLLSRIVKLALLAQLFCILATSVPCETRLLSSGLMSESGLGMGATCLRLLLSELLALRQYL